MDVTICQSARFIWNKKKREIVTCTSRLACCNGQQTFTEVKRSEIQFPVKKLFLLNINSNIYVLNLKVNFPNSKIYISKKYIYLACVWYLMFFSSSNYFIPLVCSEPGFGWILPHCRISKFLLRLLGYRSGLGSQSPIVLCLYISFWT